MAKITTITNPLTGQPAQVDQLDHTAQQIDDGLNIARGVSNPNLLDNWYFGNPVDQRQGRVVKPNTTYYSDNTLATAAGTTSAYVTAYRYATGTASGVNYASFKLTDSNTAPTYYAAPENVVRGYTGVGYGIDRWRVINSGTVLIMDNGLSVTGDLYQPTENSRLVAGSTYTLSALVDGELYYVTFKLFGNMNEEYGLQAGRAVLKIIYNWGGAYTICGLDAGSSTVATKAIKLELGSQQTLAHQDENGNWVLNEIPDYGEQLSKCQRYCLVIGNSVCKYECVGVGTTYSNTGMEIVIPTPTSLRSKPVITMTGSWIFRGNGSEMSIDAKNMVISDTQLSSGCFALDFSLSVDLTARQAYQMLRNNNTTSRIIASADL